MFSLSRILTRSAAAAGQAVINELESLQVGNAAEEAASVPVAVGVSDAIALDPGAAPAPGAEPTTASDPTPAPVAPSAPTPPPPPPGPPVVPIDAIQLAILEAATTAIVAVNLGGQAPQLTFAKVLWDGQSVRFATLGWSRRTTMLRTNPMIGLLIEGEDGRFVTVNGKAKIVENREAREATLPLLLRETAGDDAAAEARWQELLAADSDRAVIVVVPDQVLSGQR